MEAVYKTHGSNHGPSHYWHGDAAAPQAPCPLFKQDRAFCPLNLNLKPAEAPLTAAGAA